MITLPPTDLQPLDIPSTNENKKVYAACMKSLPLNPSEIIQKLKTGKNQEAVSFINAERVYSLFQLKVAVLKALRTAVINAMKSKSTQTEILYNLSSGSTASSSSTTTTRRSGTSTNRNVVDCIRWFGLRENSLSTAGAIVMVMCDTKQEFTEALQQFFELKEDGDYVELISLQEYFNTNKERVIDWDFLRKHYNLPHQSESSSIMIERLILSSMAINN